MFGVGRNHDQHGESHGHGADQGECEWARMRNKIENPAAQQTHELTANDVSGVCRYRIRHGKNDKCAGANGCNDHGFLCGEQQKKNQYRYGGPQGLEKVVWPMFSKSFIEHFIK